MTKVNSIIDKLLEVSKDSYVKRAKITGIKNEPINNHLLCIQLYKNGWKQDGFEFVKDSSDIITYWARNEERTQIKLSLYEQQLWVRTLDMMKSKGEIK